MIPSMFLGACPPAQAPYNLAKAKAALAASGLGNPTVTMVYPSDLSVNGISFGDLAARVQQDLAQVGITVQAAGPVDPGGAEQLPGRHGGRWACGTGARTSRTRATT